MLKKLRLAILLVTTHFLAYSADQEVPDINQRRYSQTAPDDGIVQATQPEAEESQSEEVNNSDSNDFAIVPN